MSVYPFQGFPVLKQHLQQSCKCKAVKYICSPYSNKMDKENDHLYSQKAGEI